MKKSLLKKLTLMARDGDPEAIEALAEAVEEIIEEPEAVAAAVEPAAETEPEAEPEEAAAEDSDILAAILERLDRLIALLAPAASDEDPADPSGALPEELAEVVEEALEAAGEPMAAPEPVPGEVAEIAAIMEEVLSGEALPDESPTEASVVLEPDDPAADADDPDSRCSADALRAALTAIRPALKGMSRAGRRKVCADIAARLNRQRAADSRKYAALLSTRKHAARDHADLGRRIMAKRNPNYHAS